ncbi:MAG: hypothetical protein AB1505_16600 [Candidatus Latescibacterota bacterium]
MAFLAGAGRADITPPVGIMQSGYAARTSPAVGVHDELTATALYLEVDGVAVGIVALDWIDVENGEVPLIRACCEKLAGIPGTHVLLAASHTHGGPEIGPEEGNPLRTSYAEAVRWQIAGALAEARHRAVPARLGHARQEARVAGNRRQRGPDGRVFIGYNPDGLTPCTTDVLRFDSAESGHPLAVVYTYGCHGTTLRHDNLWITADYPGLARRFVERQLPGTRALFLRTPGADQNPHPRGSFELAQRHGTALGAAVLQGVLEAGETRAVERLATATLTCSLPLAALPSVAACRAELEAAEAAAEEERRQSRVGAAGPAFDPTIPLSWAANRRVEAARERLAAALRGEGDLSIPVALQAIALDEVGLVSLPAEVFFAIGEEIRSRSPFRVSLPVDHANGAIGYIPTQAEVPFGGYEVEESRAARHGLFIRDDADAALIDGALAALGKVGH